MKRRTESWVSGDTSNKCNICGGRTKNIDYCTDCLRVLRENGSERNLKVWVELAKQGIDKKTIEDIKSLKKTLNYLKNSGHLSKDEEEYRAYKDEFSEAFKILKEYTQIVKGL